MTTDMRLGFEDRQKAEDLEAEMIAGDLSNYAHELISLRRESADLREAWADLTTEGHTRFKRAGSGEFGEHATLTAGNLRHVVRTHAMVESHQRHVAETLRKKNEQLLEALIGCREILNQFVEHFEEHFDLRGDTTEELLEAFDSSGGYNPEGENCRLTAQGRKYREIADAAISAVKGKP